MIADFAYRKQAGRVGWIDLVLCSMQLLAYVLVIYYPASFPLITKVLVGNEPENGAKDWKKVTQYIFIVLTLGTIAKFVKISAAVVLLFCVKSEVDTNPRGALSLLRYWRRVTIIFIVLDSLAILLDPWRFYFIIFKFVPLVFLRIVGEFRKEVEGRVLEISKLGVDAI